MEKLEGFENIILKDEAENAEKKAKALRQARNRARSLIEDAKARYIKDKTRARSKKAAIEKDEILKSPRFNKLADYDRREDIQDAYGCDILTESERDALEDLWDEREAIRNKTVDGIYKDDVTDALDFAIRFVNDLWECVIDDMETIAENFKKQQKQAEKEADAWRKHQDEVYRKLTEGE